MSEKPQRRRSTKSRGDEEPQPGGSGHPLRDAPPAPYLEYPAELPPIARQEWDRIVAELIKLGVLSKFDRVPLAIYCGAYALWAEAIEALQKYGTMIKSPTGYPVQSPYAAVVNRQADMMMRIASEFGFTPAARSRSFSYTKSQSMLLEIDRDPDETCAKGGHDYLDV